VRDARALETLADELRGSKVIALDSESDSLHHHREKVCLVQLASDRGHAVLIDPLAGLDLAPLAPLIADPAVAKVFHGADYDVTTMKRDFGFTFGGLFDTMLAARFLGLKEIGLQAVLRDELGVAVSKDSQKDDWSRRPLTPTQEAYAIADVLHLIPLYERLVARLRETGRLAWVEEESAAVAALEAARRDKDPDAWARVKGARKLNRRQQAALRAAWAWREAIAEETDIPAFKIATSETLLAVAEQMPATASDLRRIRPGLSHRALSRSGPLVEALAAVAAAEERALPVPPPGTPRPPLPPEPVRKRVDALKKWRTAEAARLGIDVSVVLPQRLLDKVAEAAPREVPALARVEGIRRWRVDALGEAIVRVVRETR
jgi:ribonuclease D